MTLPLIVFENSNLDSTRTNAQITFDLTNSGVGPPQVKTFEIDYQGRKYSEIRGVLSACCGYDEYREALRAATKNFREVRNILENIDGAIVTSSITNTVIPDQPSHTFLVLP